MRRKVETLERQQAVERERTRIAKDNGRGFDPAVLTVAATNSGQPREIASTALHTGADIAISRGQPRLRQDRLVNMRKWLEGIGGRCEFQTQPGQGTHLKFFLPMNEAANSGMQ